MSPAASASSSPAPVLAGFRSLLATNLALLGFQQRIADCAPHLDFLLVSSAASPSSPDPSPIDENMFAKPGSCVKAMEAVVYFLFQKLDSAAAQEKFSSCYPVFLDKNKSREFRTVVIKWLEVLKRESKLPADILIRRSHFDECRGDRFEKTILCLSNLVLQSLLESPRYEKYPQLPDFLSSHSNVISAKKNPDQHRARIENIKAQIGMEMNRYLINTRKRTTLEREWQRLTAKMETNFNMLLEKETLIDAKLASLSDQIIITDADFTEKVKTVRGYWKSMLTWIDIRKENSAMLEDFINGKLKTHCIDAKHLELHIPEKMIQLCRENGESMNVSPYKSGELNLSTVVAMFKSIVKVTEKILEQIPLEKRINQDTFDKLDNLISTYAPLSHELTRILGETQFRIHVANEQVTNFHQIETEELKALPVTHSKIERLNSINVSRAIPVFSAPVLNVLMGSDGSSGSSSIHTGGGDNESLNAARRHRLYSLLMDKQMSKSTVSSSNKIIINSASYTPAESLSPSIGSRSMQDEKELCDDIVYEMYAQEQYDEEGEKQSPMIVKRKKPATNLSSAATTTTTTISSNAVLRNSSPTMSILKNNSRHRNLTQPTMQDSRQRASVRFSDETHRDNIVCNNDDGFQSKKELARTPIKSNTSRVSQQQHQLQHTPITMKNFNDESSCRRVTPATPGTPALDFDDGDQILLENMTPIHKLSTYSSPCLDLVGGTNTDGGVGASDVDEFELLADIQAPPTSLVDSPLSTPSHTKSRKNVSSTRNGTGSPLIPFQDSTTTSLTAASVIARAAKHLSRAAPSSSSSTLIDLLQTPPRQSNINNNSNNNNNNSTSLRKSVLKNRIVKNTLTDLDCTAPMSQSSSSMIDQSSGSTSSSNAAMEEENLILLSPFVQYNRAMDMMGYEDKENMKETSNFDGSMLLLDEFERDISTDNSHSGEDKVINSSNSNNNITNSSLKFDGLSPIKKDLGDTARVVVVDGGGVGLEGSSTSIPSFNLLLEGTNSNDLINLDSMVLMETQNLENLLPFSSSTTTTTTAAAVKRMSIDAKSLIMYADQKSGVFVGSGGHEMGDDVLHPADLISILHMDATDFPVQLHLTKQAEGADADISLLS